MTVFKGSAIQQGELLAENLQRIGPLAMARLFGVSPEECVYVGDTWTDMQTGKAAGMYTVGVLWGFRTRKELEENHADRIISHPKELLNIL